MSADPIADRQGDFGSDPTAASRAARLQTLLAESNLSALPPGEALRCAAYVSLFIRWNARVNLSSIRDEEGILRRHIVESIAVAQQVPEWVHSLLDYGSGGGLPGIPIAICRPEIHATLAESQNKKSAFLREVVRTLGLRATVHAARAEDLAGPFDCVTLRAVDHMEKAVASATRLVRAGGVLALLTTGEQLPGLQKAAGPDFTWPTILPLPGARDSLLALADRVQN